MLNQFSRTQLLLGQDGMDRLFRARVAVFGIGGVGGYTVEALARSGVGALDLIDDDKVCLTNLNRQIIAQAAEFVWQIEQPSDSYDMVVKGVSRLLGNPEYYDAQKAQPLLELLGDKEKVFGLARDYKPQMLNIRIGPENGQGPMEGASFVFTSYDLGEDVSGIIGVIGPTRMDYSKIASRLLLLSRTLGGLMPIRFPQEPNGQNKEDQ